MKTKTIEWNPPTAEELPCNWSVQALGDDGGAYKSRDGLIVIISCCIERDGHWWVHLSLSRKKSVPTWIDLVKVKEIFLGADALALQILPPRCATPFDYAQCKARKLRTVKNGSFCEVSRIVASVNPGSSSSF